MSLRRELLAFAATLAAIVGAFFAEALFGGQVLSPADVLRVSASLGDGRGRVYEPANRLLMDPVLQFQPWLEFNRAMIRRGRLPLWNDRAGCGAPHLANGQSAVFDPFHAIAYLGTLPDALAWMAAARLWTAGLGMFLLARAWGLGPWGRWFSGLAFPFCGFLVVWLLYPVTNVAVWMPWLFWTTERVVRRPGARSLGGLALATGGVLLGGHIQTSAHVLLAAGAYALWRTSGPAASRLGYGFTRQRVLMAWGGGAALGVALAAVEVVPLGAYLARSPVWEDRAREHPSPWTLRRPRLLAAACTALPYAFGSQRRGHPHLGRALGVDNLNESAAGFAGLATLLWLAPSAWSWRRREPRVRFLAGLLAFGAFGALGLPPVDNLLRALPVLGVTDNRRLALWVAFALVLLGGIGLDRLAPPAGGRRWVARAWAIAAVVLLAGAVGVGRLGPWLEAKAAEHYRRVASAETGTPPELARARARHQVGLTLDFVPRYYALAGVHLLALAALAALTRRPSAAGAAVRPALLGLTMIDLLGFGYGLNPAIAPGDDRPDSPVVAYLRREVGSGGRALGVGEELPPNVLMRYGLADVRNYDSVELTRSLDWFAPLYESEAGRRARTSRRSVTWQGVARARARLEAASVCAVVGATPPPPGVFGRVERVGATWVARLDGAPWAGLERHAAEIEATRDSEIIQIRYNSPYADRLVIRETFDPGWRAELDGCPVAAGAWRGTFLAVEVPGGRHRVALRYDPPEVRLAAGASVFGLFAAVFALTGPRPFRSTRSIAGVLGRTQSAALESVA